MPINYIPTNSVEFETLTTEPAYGDVKEFDTNPFSCDKVEYWRALGFMNRDLRLGNLTSKDDFSWLEDRASLPTCFILFRDGVFEDLAVLSFSPVASTIEISQSREGFFRKNSRSFHSISENTERSEGGSFLSKLFGGNKKQGAGGS